MKMNPIVMALARATEKTYPAPALPVPRTTWPTDAKHAQPPDEPTRRMKKEQLRRLRQIGAGTLKP